MRAKPIGAVLLAAASVALFARAADEAEPVRARFDGAVGCSDEARFFDAIRARTSRVRPAGEGEAALTFRVTVRARGDRSVGRLVVEESARASAPRVVEAATCDEAVAALALIAALSVDPDARIADAGAADAPIEAPPAAEPDAPVAVSAPPIPAIVPVAADRPPQAAAAAPPAAPRAHVASGLGAGVPSFFEAATIAPSLFVDLAFARRALPSVRLSVGRAARDAASSSRGDAQMIWLFTDLAVCPLHTSSASLAACAEIEAGALEARVTGAATQSRTRPWLALGLAGRARPLRVDLSPSLQLFVELELGVRAPLLREAFFFEPDQTVYRAPALVLEGRSYAGMRF
jgi:hypothetical protein